MWGTETSVRAWVVTVDMGLGHQRALYPLTHLAEGGLITLGGAGDSCSAQERRLWSRLQGIYETVSRIKSVPLVGDAAFGLFDQLQRIPPYYPRRDLSRRTLQVRLVRSYLDRGLCSGMLDRIRRKPLPMITSYMAPAIAADRAGYDPVYCVICDAEVNRAWVPEDPRNCRIHYLAPCQKTVLRLASYGVPSERVTLTGFPFPLELLGGRNLDVLRSDLSRRLHALDPAGFPPLTVTYAVGGAGAQRTIGRTIVESLADRLRRGSVRLNLVAGVREEVRVFFEQAKAELLPGCAGLQIVYGASKAEYFREFSRILRETDVLWTKPSELSFYCGLGIPIVISPPIGSQELCNRRWLLEVQAGIPQEDPVYADQWLFDLLQEGRLARAAWNGFLNVRKHGTFAIADLLTAGVPLRAPSMQPAASA